MGLALQRGGEARRSIQQASGGGKRVAAGRVLGGGAGVSRGVAWPIARDGSGTGFVLPGAARGNPGGLKPLAVGQGRLLGRGADEMAARGGL